MNRTFGLRLAAIAFTLGVVLHPTAGHANPAPAAVTPAAPLVQMDHISVETIGKGKPVILIPGLSVSRENWRSTAERLAPNHRVYLVQINGFGTSAPGKNLQPNMLDGVVADLHAFITGQKIAKPAVVGHSLGGTVALMLGKAHPDDAGRLLIVDSLPWVALIMAPPTATVAQVEPQAKAMRDAMAQAFYEDMVTDLRPSVAALPMPVTLIYPWSARGPAKAAVDALYRTAYAKVPHMTFVEIADSGHFVMLDQPAAFDVALDKFLAN